MAAAGGSAITGNPGSFQAVSGLQAYAYPNPARDRIARIAVYTPAAQTADIKLLTSAGRLITTLTLNSPGEGWHVVPWEIDDVANGVYLFVIESGSEKVRGKVAVLKRWSR